MTSLGGTIIRTGMPPDQKVNKAEYLTYFSTTKKANYPRTPRVLDKRASLFGDKKVLWAWHHDGADDGGVTRRERRSEKKKIRRMNDSCRNWSESLFIYLLILWATSEWNNDVDWICFIAINEMKM
jgi:hypothetical protein